MLLNGMTFCLDTFFIVRLEGHRDQGLEAEEPLSLPWQEQLSQEDSCARKMLLAVLSEHSLFIRDAEKETRLLKDLD